MKMLLKICAMLSTIYHEIQVGDLVIFKNKRFLEQQKFQDHLGNEFPTNTMGLVLNITIEKSCDDLDPDDWLSYEIFIPDKGRCTSGWGKRSIQKIDVNQGEK
jgi:hypothetical protein